MKKVLIMILTAICACAIGYLGYVIFNAKSIDSVEIVGEMQTLYVVGDDLDFQEAQLKVTYKNGTIKMVDLDKKRVDVTSFSTSLQTHGTMKIVYKSAVLEVNYDVVNKGLYYVSGNYVTTPSSTVPSVTNYSRTTAPMLFYIKDNGELEYYYKEGSKYLMHDGEYNKSYKYEISGDTMRVYLGGDEASYELKANYNSEGTMTLKSTTITTMSNNPDIITRKVEKIYTYYEHFKTDRTISSVAVDLSKTTSTNYGSSQYIIFEKGDNIETSKKVILLQVNYANPLSSYMSTVYVHVCDGMVTRNSLDTTKVTDIAHMLCRYEGEDFDINYKVVNG